MTWGVTQIQHFEPEVTRLNPFRIGQLLKPCILPSWAGDNTSFIPISYCINQMCSHLFIHDDWKWCTGHFYIWWQDVSMEQFGFTKVEPMHMNPSQLHWKSHVFSYMASLLAIIIVDIVVVIATAAVDEELMKPTPDWWDHALGWWWVIIVAQLETVFPGSRVLCAEQLCATDFEK